MSILWLIEFARLPPGAKIAARPMTRFLHGEGLARRAQEECAVAIAAAS
jgi:hypothetical protein